MKKKFSISMDADLYAELLKETKERRTKLSRIIEERLRITRNVFPSDDIPHYVFPITLPKEYHYTKDEIAMNQEGNITFWTNVNKQIEQPHNKDVFAIYQWQDGKYRYTKHYPCDAQIEILALYE